MNYLAKRIGIQKLLRRHDGSSFFGFNFLNDKAKDKKCIEEYRKIYLNNQPYPHIEIDGLFNKLLINRIASTFPDLRLADRKLVRGGGELKRGTREGCLIASGITKQFIRHLNSYEFIKFIQEVCGINEQLIPDQTLLGGGLHSTSRGGSLGMHVDFPKHKKTLLDRRVNVLVYLNKNWESEWGGEFIASNEEGTIKKSYLPLLNKTIIFETNDHTIHGHPHPLKSPEHITRNSIAMYYYSNGRPKDEIKYEIWDKNKNQPRTTIFFDNLK